MAEITYQMVLSTIQTIALVVGIVYYLTIMRNAQKTRELTLQSQELTRKAQEQSLETREAQLFMQFNSPVLSGDKVRYFQEIHQWEWDDYEGFMRIFSDPEKRYSFNQISTFLELLGSYVRLGLIPIRLVAVTMTLPVTGFWNKFGSMIVERRMRTNTPRWLSEIEHLYDELIKYIQEHPELAT